MATVKVSAISFTCPATVKRLQKRIKSNKSPLMPLSRIAGKLPKDPTRHSNPILYIFQCIIKFTPFSSDIHKPTRFIYMTVKAKTPCTDLKICQLLSTIWHSNFTHLYIRIYPNVSAYIRARVNFILTGYFLPAGRWQCHRRINFYILYLSLIHIWRCRRSTLCRSRWSPYH